MSKENEYKSLLEEMLNWAFNTRLYLHGKKTSPEQKVILAQGDLQELDTFKAAFDEITTKEEAKNND